MATPRISGRQLGEMIRSSEVGSGPRYVEIAETVRLFAIDGRLVNGARMPSERELTEELGTSRTTVTGAYERLRELGFLESRRGSGSYLRVPTGARLAPPSIGAGLGPIDGERAGPGTPVGGDASVIDLTFTGSAGVPELADRYREALLRLPVELAGHGCYPLGLPELREAVADRYCARGLATTRDQIVITTGGLAGLAGVTQACVTQGDRVLLETPGYPGALRAARQVGARLIGWPVEVDLDIAGLAALLRQTSPRLAVLTPDFQNPTGRFLSTSQRRELGAVLAAAGVTPLIDETLLESRLDVANESTPPFGAFAPDAFTVGSVSKSHWSGLRIGWVRAPRDQVGRVVEARAGLDLGASVLEQLLVAQLMRDGVHVLDVMLDRARRQRAYLVEALRTHLPDWRFAVPPGGQTLWCRLPVEGAVALTERCAAQGVLFAPGSAFAVDGRGLDRFVRLPYTVDEAQLERAVRVIATEWNGLRAHGQQFARNSVIVA